MQVHELRLALRMRLHQNRSMAGLQRRILGPQIIDGRDIETRLIAHHGLNDKRGSGARPFYQTKKRSTNRPKTFMNMRNACMTTLC